MAGNGWTACHSAARNENLEILELLLKNGANPKLKAEGRCWSSWFCNEKVLELLNRAAEDTFYLWGTENLWTKDFFDEAGCFSYDSTHPKMDNMWGPGEEECAKMVMKTEDFNVLLPLVQAVKWVNSFHFWREADFSLLFHASLANSQQQGGRAPPP